MTHNKSLLTLVKYTTQIILMNLVLNIVSGSNDCSQPGIQMEPDEEDCACYFVCEEGKRGKHVCCDYGQWHMLKAEGVNPCVPVGEFSANYQNKCFLRMKAPGTTRNLKAIFIGRCYDYQTLEHPEFFTEKKVDCEALFRLFTSAFLHKPACGAVKARDTPYGDFIEHTKEYSSKIPRDKLLFWSSTFELSQPYSDDGERLFTLENTLLGYLVNGLWWCGQETGSGVNFRTCPPWNICEDHPVVTFWSEASVYFARLATGRATLMLNGSMPGKPAFRPYSFFGQHELPNLNCDDFKEVRIWVVHGLGLQVYENCASGSSLLELKEILTKKGCRCTCTDNPPEVLHLLCVDNPSADECSFIPAS